MYFVFFFLFFFHKTCNLFFILMYLKRMYRQWNLEIFFSFFWYLLLVSWIHFWYWSSKLGTVCLISWDYKNGNLIVLVLVCFGYFCTYVRGDIWLSMLCIFRWAIKLWIFLADKKIFVEKSKNKCIITKELN